MADITMLPIMSATDAERIGFARFNDVPTLPIDIPDGNFTISAKTTDGRRITIFFGESRSGAPSSFVDIRYHDQNTPTANADAGAFPTFDVLTISPDGDFTFDSQRIDGADKPSIAVVLLRHPDDTASNG